MPLPEPTTEAGRTGQEALLGDPAGVLLALDFDGVLAPIVEDPSQSRAQEGVLPALERLGRYLGSLAVITGRPAIVAARYAGLDQAPGLGEVVVFGHYGLERWDNLTGELQAPDLHPGVAEVRIVLPDVLRRLGLEDEVFIEDKGHSLAVHTRRARDPQGALELLRPALAELGGTTGLSLEPGRLVLELRPPGSDKGQALRRHAAERAARTVAYVGDDLGDLPAFAAVDQVRSEGRAGLKVCSGSSEVRELAGQADLVVDGPAGVVHLLGSWADVLDARHGPESAGSIPDPAPNPDSGS